jgi:hypothetical protein
MSSFFEGRQMIKAQDLKGPRVYSTDLLPSNFDPRDPAESVAVTARAIKIKIITKGLVTLNSTYLVSPLGVKLTDAYPDIFSGPAILPAFRTDKTDLYDLVSSTGGHSAAGIDDVHLRAHIQQLEQTIKQVMPWELGDVGSRFRRDLLTGLRDSNSVIRRELARRGVSERAIEDIGSEIEKLDFGDSKHLRDYIAGITDATIREPLKRFSTACYHVVGTSVVRCETGTDLSPLSDFKAADVVLAARDEQVEALSDEAIFLEAFMGFALDTIQASVLPSQIIDALSFDTAHKVSETLRKQGFQAKYDEITTNFVKTLSASDSKESLDQLDEVKIASLAHDLAEAFKREILRELPDYETAGYSEAKIQIYRAGADVARAVAGLFPGLHALVSFADIVEAGAEASGVGKELMSGRDQQKAFIEAQRKRKEKIEYAINRLKIAPEKQSKLLGAVALLSDVHSLTVARA